MRQPDLYIQDIFDVPLTRTYNSRDYIHRNPVQAFGKNTNHPYDIGPLGSRNPYTYSLIALEDGELLFFDRVSEGVGFADAIYQHTETSTRFYRAVTAWNGNGWTTWLSDGSSIQFPEAYNSTNMAQCAATEMQAAQGNVLKLIRDPLHNLLRFEHPISIPWNSITMKTRVLSAPKVSKGTGPDITTTRMACWMKLELARVGR